MDELVCRCGSCGVVEAVEHSALTIPPVFCSPIGSVVGVLRVSSCMFRPYPSPRMSFRFSPLTRSRGSSPYLVVCCRAHFAATPQQGGGDAYHTGGLSACRAATITQPHTRGSRHAATAFPCGTHPPLGPRHLAANDHQDGSRWLSGCLRLRVTRAGPGLGQTWFHRAQTYTRDDFPWSPISRSLTWQ